MPDIDLDRLVSEQPPYWEYLLSAQTLRANLKPPVQRWKDLRDGLITRRLTRLNAAEFFQWVQTRMAEARSFIDPLTELYTIRLPAAWGPPGESGSVEQIKHVCGLIAGIADDLVRWEEDVAFTRTTHQLEPLRQRISGAAGHQFNELLKVPDVLEDGVRRAQSGEDQATEVRHTIVISLPEGWTEGLDLEFTKVNGLIEAGELEMD